LPGTPPRADRSVVDINRKKERFDNRSWFLPCLKDAKIEGGYLWHCNRHTFCAWLAMAGASTKEIQEAAGHRTITMAARYAHLSPLTGFRWLSGSPGHHQGTNMHLR
jgi:site-specific recombinase XerD